MLLSSTLAIVSPMQEIVVIGQAIRTISIRLSKNVNLTWEAVKATNNITISHSDDIKLTHKQDGPILQLEQERISSGSVVNRLKLLTLIPSLLIAAGLDTNQVLIGQLGIVLVLGDYAETQEVSQIHIKIPVKYVTKMCTNGDNCFPTYCKLSEDSAGYSNVPSYNNILFYDNHCNIRKPSRWDEWVAYHYNTNQSFEDFYLYDTDNDKLVNILEYYANQDILVEQGNNGKVKRSLDQITPINNVGTNPNLADTDKDLLLDGFEFFNSMSPTEVDSFSSDYDHDKLSNLDEQIHHTDPKNADSDGDGVTDGEEVAKSTNPNDPSDEGRGFISTETALIKLTIGDHSGSHSERYTITVGDISHQSPNFGVVGSGEYDYGPGKYIIQVTWVATRFKVPDYDYTAKVEKVSGSANVKIEDPLHILGRHDESNYDYALGKTATMIVTANCSETSDKGECIDNCEECRANPEYFWVVGYLGLVQSCFKKRLFDLWSLSSSETCPCKKCLDWYNQEMKDTRWLNYLNDKFKCPCYVENDIYSLKAVNSCSGNWEPDNACRKYSMPMCFLFHPGAHGCIRSKQKTACGAQQQCCYDSQLKLIPSGDPGAGTPDKAADYSKHQDEDVEPYHWCCKQCEKKEYCDYYIKGPRKGGNSCNKCP